MQDKSETNHSRENLDDLFGHVEGQRELVPKNKAKGLQRGEDSFVRSPARPTIRFWLCCEGWMRFGPFEWLRFDDEKQAILGPDGAEVAKKEGGQWRVPGEKWQGWGFSNPTITTSAVHPHPKSGSHPMVSR